MSFKQEVCEIDGCRITLRRGGSGGKLLYLHGINGVNGIDAFLEELSGEYEVWVPEHPGFGASDEPEWLDNIQDMAFFYLDFLERFDLRDITLIGGSLGGWIALELAIRDVSRLRSLTAIGPAGIYAPGLRKGDLFLWNPEERVRNLFVDQTIPDRILAQPVTPAHVEAGVKNLHTTSRLAWEPRMFDPNLHKWLHRVRVPVQIVWGENDRLLPSGYAAEWVKRIPGSRADVVPDCGHMPHIEKPQEFLRLFREFVTSPRKA